MVNAEELCQLARFGQISKIQKALQTHYFDINALNLYGESALSMATSHNQILCVEYLLANKADPKLQLSAGHTAVHIACRLANVPMLNLLLKVTRDGDMNDQQFQEKQDRHLYECFQIRDHANLTPIHWAATQESVSKRQKMFAYLDRRMPGVLDSRYNNQWFHSWAKTHPWITEQKSTQKQPIASSIQSGSKLTNTDETHQQYSELSSSLPLTKITCLDMTPRTSLNEYERTPIPPPTATTTIKTKNGYDEIYEKNSRIVPKIALSSQPTNLPLTPITSRIITFKHPNLKHEHHESSTKNINIKDIPQKTPYSQRLGSIIKHTLSPLSTYRAERAHVIPTFHYPPSPGGLDSRSHKGHIVDDVVTPISSKRPSHNLLSNIIPSTSTSSSDQSSRQSTKLFCSFGFDASLDLRNHHDATSFETYTHDDENDSYDEDDNPRDYETNAIDYLCNSPSSFDLSSSGVDSYDL